MTPETLKALKGSIEKWRKIVEEGAEDGGTTDCPLCELFWRDDCDGCPVKWTTGRKNCRGTPYQLWNSLTTDDDKRADTPERMDAARAELELLRSLLPQEAAS